MAGRCAMLAMLLATLAVSAAPSLVVAGDVPEWPSEQEQRLTEVEQQSLDLQRKLFAARMMQNSEEVKRLSKEFKAVQDERVDLMRATGLLPPRASR